MAEQKLSKRTGCWWVGLAVVGILVVAGFLFSVPWNVSSIASHPHPVSNYAEAMQRIDAWRSKEPAAMNAVCHLQSMTHGNKAARAIVLVHGYTNCPQQFHDLGQQFYDAGYNVLIAPLPYHGLSDRMSEAHSQLTAENLASYTDETIDIARGLGDQVTILGLSGGGVIASWAAQNRSDVDVAVIVAPGFGYGYIPTPLTALVMNFFEIVPSQFVWWNPDLKENTTPSYGYPRFSTRALAEVLRLGFVTQADAQQHAPAAKKLVVVLNGNDVAVNNEMNKQVVQTWQAHGGNVFTYEFDAALKLEHDIIDPSQPNQKIDMTYPVLIKLASQ